MSQQEPQLPEDLKRRRDQATVEKAEADARKAEADARKAAADAAKAEDDVRRGKLAELIPDLSKVDDSTLEREKDVVIGRSTALAFGALQEAAEAIAETILPDGGPKRPWKILVTSQAALADADAAYHDVTSGLKSLTVAAEKLLSDLEQGDAEFAGGLEVAALLAGAIPQVLSLLSGKRALATAAVTVNDLAAAAAVIDELKGQPHGATIYHDDFRLLATGDVYRQAETLTRKRQELAGRKLGYADKKARLEAELAKAKKEEKPEEVTRLEREIAGEAVRIGLIDSLIPVMDAYGGAIRAIPAGQTRSPLAAAALHELLHASEDGQRQPGVSHVLLVKSQGGTAEQLLNNRPLWLEDKFSTIVDVSVTFILIATADSQVVHAGTETRVVKAHGKIGDKVKIEIA